jgi:hypothetical protein
MFLSLQEALSMKVGGDALPLNSIKNKYESYHIYMNTNLIRYMNTNLIRYKCKIDRFILSIILYLVKFMFLVVSKS